MRMFPFSGIGSGIFYVCLRVSIMLIFKERRGFALGLASLGMTISGSVVPQLFHFLRGEYGFQVTLLLFGTLLMNVTPLAYLLRAPEKNGANSRVPHRGPTPRPSEMPIAKEVDSYETKTAPLGTREIGLRWLRDISILGRAPVFYVLILSLALALAVMFDASRIMLDFALDKGIALSDAVWYSTYSTFASVPGYILLPSFVDRGYVSPMRMLLLCQIVLSVAFMAAPHVTTYWAIAAVSMAVSLCSSASGTLHDVLMADTVGVDGVSLVYGFAGFLLAPLELCSPALIRKYTGSGRSVIVIVHS